MILRFCSEPDIQSCGSLGIKARAEMPAAECRDREKVVRWLESLSGGLYGGRNFEEFILANNVFAKDASRLEPATLAGLEGWRTGTANRMLVLCDRAHAWVVLEISFEGKGREPARIAFDLFLRTARIEPAPTTAR